VSIVPIGGVASIRAGGSAPALAGQILRGDAGPQFPARMGIGGPLDGVVLRSNSTRLDYRKPIVTVVHDIETLDTKVGVDAPPIVTYLPKIMNVVPYRSYRIWVQEKDWHPIFDEDYPDPSRNEFLWQRFREEVIQRLIDAAPEDNRACRQLP